MITSVISHYGKNPSPQYNLHKKINNNKQTKNIQILYNLAVPALTLLEIFGSPAHYLSNFFGVQLISVSIDSVSTLASMFRVDVFRSHYSVICEAVY
jgi:hypothetical protein